MMMMMMRCRQYLNVAEMVRASPIAPHPEFSLVVKRFLCSISCKLNRYIYLTIKVKKKRQELAFVGGLIKDFSIHKEKNGETHPDAREICIEYGIRSREQGALRAEMKKIRGELISTRIIYVNKLEHIEIVEKLRAEHGFRGLISVKPEEKDYGTLMPRIKQGKVPYCKY